MKEHIRYVIYRIDSIGNEFVLCDDFGHKKRFATEQEAKEHAEYCAKSKYYTEYKDWHSYRIVKEDNENETNPIWKPCKRTYKELF